jgi:hypothetical protein
LKPQYLPETRSGGRGGQLVEASRKGKPNTHLKSTFFENPVDLLVRHDFHLATRQRRSYIVLAMELSPA